jgi:K+/H+ antiporter YhaU regulatory subunit KhtT
LAGVTVAQTTAWREHKLLVVAVKRQSGEYAFNPNGDDSFQVADVVVVMGHRKDIERFRAEHT